MELEAQEHKGYGSVNNFELDFDELEDLDFNHSIKVPNKNRWSVLEKLDSRHYCRIRNCYDCFKILNFKSVFAIVMLAACVMMIYLFMAVLFFFTDLSYPVQYDYIIVGGGPAGSVVARRLVDEGAKVLLIEAGDATQYDLGGTDYYSAPLTRFDIPLLWPSISKSSSFQWSGFNSTQVLLAKGLGGCGVSSGLIYMRALASDIVNWNVEGWTWKNVLGKYQSLESYIPSANSSSANGVNEVAWFHGGAGPIVTSTQQYIDKVASFFVSAAANSGLSLVDDFNDPSVSRAGAGIYHVNTVRGQRDGAARALLGPLLTSSGKRPNFFLTLNATVLRVMLTKETVFSSDLSIVAESYRAVGVEYRQGLSDEIKTAYLTSGPSKPEKEGSMDTEGKRHVVLTAGAVMTPKILLNSGVGSKTALDAAGIPLKVSSPQVGRNLQDHPAVGMVFTLEDSIAATFPSSYSFASDWTQYIDATQQTSPSPDVDFGVMGSTGHAAGAFLVSPNAVDPSIPDIQVTVYPAVSEPHFLQSNWRNGSTPSGREMLITVSLLTPQGRQIVTLDSTAPLTRPPLIATDLSIPTSQPYCYLTDRDVKTLSWAVDRVREILSTRPLTGATREVFPGTQTEGKKKLSEWIRGSWFPNSNYAGSARMATDSIDPLTGLDVLDTSEAVLDQTLRVRGVYGLMVADASAMPLVPNGNIHATVLVMADMAADFILGTGAAVAH